MRDGGAPGTRVGRARAGTWLRLAVGLLALAAVALALWRLSAATAPLAAVEAARVGDVPVTVYRPPPGAAAAPAVVVAHGFAGSQQLMQPFAVTLARHGAVAVTFDFPGHGRNPVPLAGGGARGDEGAAPALPAALDAVVRFARALPGTDGRITLLGHSMAAGIVVRRAMDNPDGIAATVAVSVFARGTTAESPRNLLVVVGALEPAALREEGARIVGQLVPDGEGDAVEPGVTYGRFEDGTARRLVLSRGVEHIGVLYGRDGLEAATAWLDAAFGSVPRPIGFVDARGPWIGLLVLGLVALAWPLAGLLPSAADRPLGAGLPWRRLLPVAIGPAIATPLLVRLVPTGGLPLLLGDYMVAHFALYGALTALALRLLRAPTRDAGPRPRVSWPALAAGAVAVGAYWILAVGLLLDAFVVSFAPVGARWWLVPAMLAGTLPWFLADEWATRGPGARRGAYALTKLCFLLSLALAIALDLPRLFFLIIIVPVVLVLFVAYGLIGAWVYAATRHPFAAAAGHAAALAWAIAVTFPLVAR